MDMDQLPRQSIFPVEIWMWRDNLYAPSRYECEECDMNAVQLYAEHLLDRQSSQSCGPIDVANIPSIRRVYPHNGNSVHGTGMRTVKGKKNPLHLCSCSQPHICESQTLLSPELQHPESASHLFSGDGGAVTAGAIIRCAWSRYLAANRR